MPDAEFFLQADFEFFKKCQTPSLCFIVKDTTAGNLSEHGTDDHLLKCKCVEIQL